MSVVVRWVKTALRTEYQKAGGIVVVDAIRRADENLSSMSDVCLEQIDAALGLMAAMTEDPPRPLDAIELRKLHTLVNDMLAACAGIEIEGLVDALYAVGRLIGAMMAADVGTNKAITPAINVLRLVRRGSVSPEDRAVLIDGIDHCARRFARMGDQSSTNEVASSPAEHR